MRAAISPRFELLIDVGAFGVGGEECGVFLGGHVKVLIDLARLTKLQLQHAFLGERSRCWRYCWTLLELSAFSNRAPSERALSGCE